MLFDDKTKGIAQAYLSMLGEAKKDPKMDPVGKEDGDVDNDGDKDSSDEYLKKRRTAISKSVKEEAVDEACGTPMKTAKKEALDINPASKSEVGKKGMKDKEGGDEEDDSDEKDGGSGDDEIEITIKKKKDGGGSEKKDGPPMKKEGYKSAAQRKAVWASRNEKGVKESAVWNWDEILEASDAEIDELIEHLEGDDLQSFMAEFSELSEMYPQAKQGVDKAGQEKLEPRAPAEKAFADKHKAVEKDHPFDKDQHDQGVKKQAPTRPGEKRANEPMKSLKDIRK